MNCDWPVVVLGKWDLGQWDWDLLLEMGKKWQKFAMG